VLRGEGSHDHLLSSAVRACYREPVTLLNRPVRFGALTVHIDLAAATGPLGLRPGLEQTGDVEPDIKSGTVVRSVLWWHLGR
jgi:hypothetical protein|tara:strand:- start:212 stop:457 length:246 start_codon:yes stop_codon:yes gene_type:complete